MKKITDFFKRIVKWIASDGLLHLLVSAILCVFLGWIRPLWIIPLVVITIGIAKEVYDRVCGKGMAEWHDVFCDLIGVVVGMIALLINLVR